MIKHTTGTVRHSLWKY